MKIISFYVVEFEGSCILLETTGALNSKGYGKYFTFSLLAGILPLKEEIALSLIIK